jgi:predicted HTH transcriptional regulator
MASLFESINSMQLVKTGLSLSERIARRQRERMITRLRYLREQWKEEMKPEPWTVLESRAVLILNDVCNALDLTEGERAQVLGQDGIAALIGELDAKVYPALNERQLVALTTCEKHGRLTMRVFRAVCPQWSSETLRLDLADLVKRGLLIKNGNKRGTNYTLPTKG